jgi:serine/threonine protein kinase
VYQGIDLHTGKFIAVKQVTLCNEASAAAKALRREIDLLCALPDHKHIVRYLGTEQTEDSARLFIFLEYVRSVAP